jgi:hypothetical protein
MKATILAALHSAGLDSIVPLLLALHATANAIDAMIPQPKPGSHWLPLRKLVSIAAGNVHYATNGLQPPILSWVQRIAGMLVAILPPAPIQAPRVDPIPPSVMPAPPPQPAPLPKPLFPTVPTPPQA